MFEQTFDCLTRFDWHLAHSEFLFCSVWQTDHSLKESDGDISKYCTAWLLSQSKHMQLQAERPLLVRGSRPCMTFVPLKIPTLISFSPCANSQHDDNVTQWKEKILIVCRNTTIAFPLWLFSLGWHHEQFFFNFMESGLSWENLKLKFSFSFWSIQAPSDTPTYAMNRRVVVIIIYLSLLPTATSLLTSHSFSPFLHPTGYGEWLLTWRRYLLEVSASQESFFFPLAVFKKNNKNKKKKKQLMGGFTQRCIVFQCLLHKR